MVQYTCCIFYLISNGKKDKYLSKILSEANNWTHIEYIFEKYTLSN